MSSDILTDKLDMDCLCFKDAKTFQHNPSITSDASSTRLKNCFNAGGCLSDTVFSIVCFNGNM